MKKIFYLTIMCLVFMSCGQNKIEKLISDYEQTIGGVKTDLNLKVKELSLSGILTAKDSLSLYKNELDSLKASYYPKAKLDTISDEFVLNAIAKLAADFGRLKDETGDSYYYKKAKDWSKNKVEFESLIGKIDNLNNPDSVIFNVYDCMYTINNPFLGGAEQTIKAKYYLLPDDSKIIVKKNVDL